MINKFTYYTIFISFSLFFPNDSQFMDIRKKRNYDSILHNDFFSSLSRNKIFLTLNSFFPSANQYDYLYLLCCCTSRLTKTSTHCQFSIHIYARYRLIFICQTCMYCDCVWFNQHQYNSLSNLKLFETTKL